MEGHKDRHVEDELQAWLDGELSEAKAEAIRDHVDGCERCREALLESEAAIRALRADAEAQPLRPMWPEVKAAISPTTRPRFGLSFGFATSFAAAAGLVIGLAIGSPGKLPSQEAQVESGSTQSLLEDGYVLTLDQIYVSVVEENGESNEGQE